MLRRLAFLLVLPVMLAALMLGWTGYAQQNEKGVLADLISRALSSSTTQVSIGAVDGALSSDATVRDLVISDRDGPWLKLDRARLVWSRLALLSGTLAVDKLEIGRLEIMRRPAPSDGKPANADEPLLPELPVKVVVKGFSLAELALGPSLAGGVPARLAASGSASLGAPSEGLDLKLEAHRTDAQGTFDVVLAFVPQSQALKVAVKLDEPGEGLLARIAALPGLPPVRLNLSGDGKLDDFDAKLDFAAGPDIGADGAIALKRQGAGRRLTPRLDARIAGLLPAIVAPVFAGDTRLGGTVDINDDGSVAVNGLSLAAALARLDIEGSSSADRKLDFRIAASAVPNADGATKTQRTSIGQLAMVTTIRGPALGPDIEAKLNAAGIVVPQGRVGRVAARFSARPTGALTADDTRLALDGDGRVEGLALADPGLAAAAGDRLAFRINGTSSAAGQVDVDTLNLTAGSARLDYAGALGPERIAGTAKLALQDLSRFAALADRPLQGALNLSAGIDGTPRQKAYTVRLDGGAERLATGIAVLDRLTGGTLGLTGGVRLLAGGGYGVDTLKLAGRFAELRANGSITDAAANLATTVSVPDLKRADGRLAGRAAADLRFGGTLKALDATARVGIADARMLDRPVPNLTLDGTAHDLTGRLSADATLAGEVDRKPLAGALSLRRQGAGWRLDGLNLSAGSASLKGVLALDGEGIATGDLHFAAKDLDDLSALALTRLAGDLDLDLVLASSAGGQDVRVAARGRKLRAASAEVSQVDGAIAATDLYRKPRLDADFKVGRATIAGESIETISLLARGGADASDIEIKARARGLDIASTGRLFSGPPIRLDLQTLEARRQGHRIALEAPTSITAIEGGVAFAKTVIGIDGGRVTVEGKAGRQLDLALSAKAVPLAAARIAMPTLEIAGTLEAQAKLAGTPQAPTGPWSANISRLSVPQMRQSGLPPAQFTASGDLAGDRTSLDATLTLGKSTSLRARGAVPLKNGAAIDLALAGKLDAALANATLATDGRRLTGILTIDARIGGTTAKPVVSGGATFAGGSFSDALQGVRLDAITASIAARGEEITIDRFSARTRNGGSLSASGNVRLDPAAGFPGAITLQGEKAELVSNGIVTAVADLSLKLSGPLAQRPVIDGRIGLRTMEVRVPDRLPASLKPLDGTRHLNPTPAVKARLAAAARAKRLARGRQGKDRPFVATLAITVSAPGQVFVRGRGIDAELGGELRLTGTSAEPVAVGAFDLRRGRLTVLTQRLDFTRGRVTFAGDTIPELDFLAQTQAGSVTARIAVTGTAAEPAFAFSSQPDLPQDEVLSRLLFAKGSGSLTAFQAIQLAQAAAQFAGGGGDDSFEKLRKSLGVDNLDIQMGANGPTVGVSRYIGNNLSVGVKTGAKPEDSGVSADLYISRHLRLQGEATANGGGAVGIATEWEY